MKCLPITSATTLNELSEILGRRVVNEVLIHNGLSWDNNVGRQLIDKHTSVASDSSIVVSNQRKSVILNKLRNDSDLFEHASLMNEAGWRVLDALNAFYGWLTIPDTVSIIDESKLVGNNEPISNSIAVTAVDQMLEQGKVDPSTFNEYSMVTSALAGARAAAFSQTNIFDGFKIPQHEVTLYSSLADSYVDFPVYPEIIPDKVSANYDTMPDLLYQYEPWYTYKSTGPRENSYIFEFHRDMWTGDHRDGKAFQLVQFCKANCYPRFRGSSVHTSYVTLYIGAQPEISGILTSADVEWDGPIGLDKRPLHGKLTLTIIEVAEEPLNFDTVMNKQYTYAKLEGGLEG